MKPESAIVALVALMSACATQAAPEQSHSKQSQRRLLLADPLLNFDDLLFVKRVPGSYSHMSDQNYGWWSRPGGGVFILKNWKNAAEIEGVRLWSQTPPQQPETTQRSGTSMRAAAGASHPAAPRSELVCLTPQFAPGSFLRPDLSYDGQKILFAYRKHYPHVAAIKNKTDKRNVPEDTFYHVFEMNVDGSGLRQLTRGRYDDFDARYLPSGEIVFLSTRRGQFVQSTKNCATATVQADALPDSYVRCGGGDWRPVAVYTLHVMNADGADLRPISPFENFEWDPSVAGDGRILYSRWDYVDRDNMPFMSLWSTNPDGTNPQLVYGNHTRSPYGVFEARAIPGSRKLVFTASAHHSIAGGSLVLLDVDRGNEGSAPLKRLTPEVPFPEIEDWPTTWYASPWPLSEDLFLCAWSDLPLRREGQQNYPNALGLYLYHFSGARELIYRDPDISSTDPIPLRPRQRPPVASSHVAWDGAQEGRFLLLDVYQGLESVKRGSVKSLRIVGVPAKTQPQMNSPRLGLTADDPGKCILGTVPVEADGSAYFRVPSGMNVFFQALDADGLAVQTMRTVSYVQPGQTLSCIGCHEHRSTAPPSRAHPLATAREASRIIVGPEGTWPLRFDRLVQPVLDDQCVRCHQPNSELVEAAKFNLTPVAAYDALVSWGKPSLKDHVKARYSEGQSKVGEGAAQTSVLLSYLKTDARHREMKLDFDAFNRLVTWMDTYAQRLGSFSDDQEKRLEELRHDLAALLQEDPPPK